MIDMVHEERDPADATYHGPCILTCRVPDCGYTTGVQPCCAITQALSVWHLYEEHAQLWFRQAGYRTPTCPDPRNPYVYIALAMFYGVQ